MAVHTSVLTGTDLAERRHAAGLTQHELAIRAGISIGTVTKHECGLLKGMHPLIAAQIDGALRKAESQAMPTSGLVAKAITQHRASRRADADPTPGQSSGVGSPAGGSVLEQLAKADPQTITLADMRAAAADLDVLKAERRAESREFLDVLAAINARLDQLEAGRR